MNNKKLVISILTAIFIGVTGFIYSLGAVSTPGKEIIVTKDALESENETKTAMQQTDQTDQTEQSGQIEHSGQSVTGSTETGGRSGENSTDIYVHICGAVRHSDVYVLPSKSRLIDGVKLAGGFTKGAAKSEVNQARELVDGERVYIPTLEEVKSGSGAITNAATKSQEGSRAPDSGKININQAGKEELMTLPGIGEAKATSVITYREQNGSFRSIEELKNIEGIKEGVFRKIQSFITIN